VATPKVRAIIFDIGRVLIRIDASRAMKGLATGLSLSPDELWSAIEKDPAGKIGRKAASLRETGTCT